MTTQGLTKPVEYHSRVVIPIVGCCADCQQGRTSCKCPESCEMPITDEDRRFRAVWWRVGIALTAAIWGAVYLVLR